jgi:hypothetical protein
MMAVSSITGSMAVYTTYAKTAHKTVSTVASLVSPRVSCKYMLIIPAENVNPSAK